MISKRVSLAAVAALFSLCAWASAATIVDFKPNPVSPTTPEFQFSRALGGGVPVFRGALGATSNNDGNLPVQNQTAPGPKPILRDRMPNAALAVLKSFAALIDWTSPSSPAARALS